MDYNTKHGITPKTIQKNINDITKAIESKHQKTVATALAAEMGDFEKNPEKFIKAKKKRMEEAVAELDFETAAVLRDEIFHLESRME